MFKKLRILVSAQHALMLAYRAEIYLWVLAHVLPFIMMSVWMKAAASPGADLAMTSLGYARYFAAVFIVRQFTAVWMIYEFEWYVVEGRLSPMLLRPMNVLWHFVAAHLGEQMARLPFFLAMLALFFVLYPAAFWVCPGPPGRVAAALGLGIVAIYAAFALRFAMQYCITMATFWFERASAIDQLTWLPYLFLSGMIIPLADMPAGVRQVLYLTPFPYCIDFPARILMGTLQGNDPLLWQGFAVMAAWFAAQSLLGAMLWKLGLRQYSGHGAQMMILRTLKCFWLTSLASEMEYRANFITSTLYSLGQLAGTVLTVNVLYSKNYQFQGWDENAAYIVVALFTLLDGISSSALSPNLSRIVQHVQRGTMDFILLKPLDAQFQLSTRNLTPWGFPNVLFALGLLAYAGTRSGLPWHGYVLGLLSVGFSILILYALWFMVATTTIWFTKVWNATEVLRSFVEAGKYPMSAYHPAVQFFFTFVLPVAFLTTVPAEIMRGSRGPAFLAVEALIAGGLLVVARLFWKWALRYYTSASS